MGRGAGGEAEQMLTEAAVGQKWTTEKVVLSVSEAQRSSGTRTGVHSL